MKFLLDHDVPDEVAAVLKHLGNEVHLVRETLGATTPDAEIFVFAQREQFSSSPAIAGIFWRWREGCLKRNRHSRFMG